MDNTLFILALLVFATLYIGLGVYLLWTLVITILVILAYLTGVYKHVLDNYPYNAGENLTTVLLIATTWVVFIVVGPKPVQFWGPSLFYAPPPEAFFASIAAVLVIFAFVVFIILAIILPHYERRGGMGASGGGSQGDQTVGAG